MNFILRFIAKIIAKRKRIAAVKKDPVARILQKERRRVAKEMKKQMKKELKSEF